MLGYYENFPNNIQSISFFQYQNSKKDLQQAILHTFYRLNSETFDLITVTPYLKKKYLVGFEFGIAEGFEFNFLDNYELELCLHSVEEYELEILDFFFVIRYHYTKDNSKQVPLWFDYLVLRFLFQKGKLELRIRHEKGTQRILLDDLTNFLVEQINIELSKKKLNPLFMEFGKISEK